MGGCFICNQRDANPLASGSSVIYVSPLFWRNLNPCQTRLRMKTESNVIFVQQCTHTGKLLHLGAAAKRSLPTEVRKVYLSARRQQERRSKLRTTGSWPFRIEINVPLGDQDAAFARNLAREKYPHRSNWESPEGGKETTVISRSHGSYSSRCSFTRWSYTPVLKSYAFISRWGGNGLLYHHHQGTFVVSAPRGWYWTTDENGLCLKSKSFPKDDYHPISDDLKKGPRFVHRQAVALRRKRQAKQRESRQDMAGMLKGKHGVRVGLHDSHDAGNCDAGTLAFARRHGLDPKGYYSPAKLLALEPDNQRIKLAIAMAIRRHKRHAANGGKVCYRRTHSKMTGGYIMTLAPQPPAASAGTIPKSGNDYIAV